MYSGRFTKIAFYLMLLLVSLWYLYDFRDNVIQQRTELFQHRLETAKSVTSIPGSKPMIEITEPWEPHRTHRIVFGVDLLETLGEKDPGYWKGNCQPAMYFMPKQGFTGKQGYSGYIEQYVCEKTTVATRAASGDYPPGIQNPF